MDNQVPVYSFAAPRRQLFAFPPDVITSMLKLKDPSSHRALLKLYQTCKYFYGKRPILLVSHLYLTKKEPCINYQGIDVNLSEFNIPIWVTDQIHLVSFENRRFPSIYRSSVTCIYFRRDSNLRFKDFVFLSSKEMLQIYCEKPWPDIYHSSTKKASIEQLLRHLPSITHFNYFIDENCSAETITTLNNLILSKFNIFGLNILDVHPTFDMNMFCDFLAKISKHDGKINISPSSSSRKQLKLALQNLSVKWQINASLHMKKFFNKINTKWMDHCDW